MPLPATFETRSTRIEILHRQLDAILTAVETLFHVGRKDIFFEGKSRVKKRQPSPMSGEERVGFARAAAIADARHAFYYLAVESLYRTRIGGKTVTRGEIGEFKPHPQDVDLRTHVLRGWQKISTRLGYVENSASLRAKHEKSFRFRSALDDAKTEAEVATIQKEIDAAVASDLLEYRKLRNRIAAAPKLIKEIEEAQRAGLIGCATIYGRKEAA